jgi:hypothetical protein
MEYSLYPTYLALSALWLFPKIKSVLKRPKFQDIEGIHKKKKKMTELKIFPQQDSQNCFQRWEHRLAKCMAAQGEYFEGDPSQYAVSIQV